MEIQARKSPEKAAQPILERGSFGNDGYPDIVKSIVSI